MASDTDITYIFNEVAHDYGIEYVSVRVTTRFKDFKIKWSRIIRENDAPILLTVSHYMRIAPEWFIKESANRVLSKIIRGTVLPTTREYDRWIEANRYIWQGLRGE